MNLREGRLVLFILAPLLLVAMPAAATAATTVHVVERAVTDAVTNGSEGDREGNVLTWHNKVYDAQNKHQVGRDAGYCVRIVVGKSWECSWTTYLKGGSISVQGPFSDTGNTVLAITGGTGAYVGGERDDEPEVPQQEGHGLRLHLPPGVVRPGFSRRGYIRCATGA